MEIQTTRFGRMEINADTVLYFPNGIPGFEKCTKFKLLHDKDTKGQKSCYWLQSLDDPDVTLQSIDPTVLGINYEFKLTEEEANLIKLKNAEDIAMLLLVSKNENAKEGESSIKAHMTNPIIINVESAIGFQKALRNQEYDLNINTVNKD